jgi:uncharacterized small protein (DUF1192 family)
MQVVAELETCLEKHPDAEGCWVAELQEKLAVLAETLKAHFKVENEGPLYRGLPESHPRLANRLRALEAEHGVLLTRLSNVQEQAAGLRDPEPYELRELNARAQLLVARIQRHEAQENEIVMEAHWGEVGVGD